MEIINLITVGMPDSANFIVKIIIWLVNMTSSVVAGIILFTVLLKVITLPFDFFSRASMRKNSLKMEEMRPELEKLQKQYANDKELYNQKMMALYKKNGYSMFGSCLPTILSLVIFIVAINGFQEYSSYQNKKYFHDMSVAYNSAIYSEFASENISINGVDYITVNEDGSISVKDAKIFDDAGVLSKETGTSSEISDGVNTLTIKTTEETITNASGNEEKVKYYDLSINGNADLVYRRYFAVNSEGSLSFSTYNFYATSELKAQIIEDSREKSAESFRNADKKFLWVQNVWEKDSPMEHPVKSNFNLFNSSYGNTGLTESSYNELTFNLNAEKNDTVNGYFILVILTAGTSLLLQLITSKSQKAQMELQTVDGQGAQSQKMMTYMMPIMMAVFAFMYTAAFCIYIVLSSIISIGTTFMINGIIDLKYKNQKAQEKPQVVRGRVYVPKEEPKKEEPKKKSKAQKEKESDGFLSGKFDKKKR